MNEIKISAKELALLNSKTGLLNLLRNEKIDLQQAIEESKYVDQLRKKQEELVKLQKWVIKNDEKIVVIFEGRDAAGKGGSIKRITEHINPRHFRTVALNIPTDDERKQWFFQRYISRLPKPGEMVFFDRSWYNRAIVEPVNKFCTNKEYKIFMSQVNDFENMLIQSDTRLIKIYLSITKREQAKRFKEIKSDPVKRWKMTPVDEKAQELWSDYSNYKRKMFKTTSTAYAPWKIIDANEKYSAWLEVITHILDTIPYK